MRKTIATPCGEDRKARSALRARGHISVIYGYYYCLHHSAGTSYVHQGRVILTPFHGESRNVRSVHLRLVDGLPAQRIQEVAIKEDAALIVMGTHGRAGLSRLTVGSVATDVAQHSCVPVTKYCQSVR